MTKKFGLWAVGSVSHGLHKYIVAPDNSRQTKTIYCIYCIDFQNNSATGIYRSQDSVPELGTRDNCCDNLSLVLGPILSHYS